jgi:hypothetical protein
MSEKQTNAIPQDGSIPLHGGDAYRKGQSIMLAPYIWHSPEAERWRQEWLAAGRGEGWAKIKSIAAGESDE